MLIEGILLLLAAAVGVLVIGTLSTAALSSPISREEEHQADLEPKPEPCSIYLYPWLIHNPEEYAAMVEMYRYHHEEMIP